jgi:hypothetical protein
MVKIINKEKKHLQINFVMPLSHKNQMLNGKMLLVFIKLNKHYNKLSSCQSNIPKFLLAQGNLGKEYFSMGPQELANRF